MSCTVGIDVHKASLVITCHPSGEHWTSGTSADELTALAASLTAVAPAVIVLEPTGGYERPIIAALRAAKLPVARVNGERIRAFAQQKGIRAKSDRLDARVLAAFGAAEHPAPLSDQDAADEHRRDLVTRRRQLIDLITAEQHRCACVDAEIVASHERLIADVRTELARIAQQLQTIVAADTPRSSAQAQYGSVPGLGTTTATNLVVTLPELGQVSAKRIAALVGVAPITKQSGASADHGHIGGGRTEVRTALWMPVLGMVTRRTNPVIAAFAARLRAQGKPFHLVMIAAMRKLLVILNAMRRDGTLWHEPERAMT